MKFGGECWLIQGTLLQAVMKTKNPAFTGRVLHSTGLEPIINEEKGRPETWMRMICFLLDFELRTL